MLVLVLLALCLLFFLWFIGDDPVTLSPGVALSNFSLQEVHSSLRLRNELQLKVSDTEVPPGINSDNI